jgi:hypothetical protein
MGDCVFCGNSAGLFHHEHPECRQKHKSGKRQMGDLILTTAVSLDTAVSATVRRIDELAEQSFIPETEREDWSLSAWSKAVDEAIDKGFLSEQSETRLVELKNGLRLSPDILLRTDTGNV